MDIHLVSCLFPLLCPAFQDCNKEPDEDPLNLRFRLQDEALIAELWTPASPEHSPWPAIVQHLNLPQPTWVFFSTGDIHGSWMVSLNPNTGDARLSVHSQAVFAGHSIYVATGSCKIRKQDI